jgi:hypothetical protein
MAKSLCAARAGRGFGRDVVVSFKRSWAVHGLQLQAKRNIRNVLQTSLRLSS